MRSAISRWSTHSGAACATRMSTHWPAVSSPSGVVGARSCKRSRSTSRSPGSPCSATGNPRTAEPLLAPVLESPTDILTAVEAWITAALVAEHERQGNRSVDALARAFAIAEPEELRRPFLVTGRREMAALVERQALLV